MDSHPCPSGPSNPHHNAWTVHEKVLTSELQAQRDADLEKERFWLVESSTGKNRTGTPTAYKLMARDPIRVMAQPEAAFMRRAGYTKHTLWVTHYHPQERYPGGEFPNQDPRPNSGLPEYASKDRYVLCVYRHTHTHVYTQSITRIFSSSISHSLTHLLTHTHTKHTYPHTHTHTDL
jgi:Cu2+-containing amine oxidase